MCVTDPLFSIFYYLWIHPISQHVYWSGFVLGGSSCRSGREAGSQYHYGGRLRRLRRRPSGLRQCLCHSLLSPHPPKWIPLPLRQPLHPSMERPLLSMLKILSTGGGGKAVARWRGDGGIRVLASARCCRKRGEDTTINIRKLFEWLLFDSEPIQSWRNDDQSTVAIFLNFPGRILVQNANPNEVILQPMLWRHPIDARV
jgi:hypothetical protein